MRVARPEPIQLLLRAGRGVGGGPAADGIDRPAVHRPSVLWQSPDDDLAGPARGGGQPKASPTTDAGDGAGGDLSQAEALGGRPGPQGLSLPAAGREGWATRSGLEHRYYLRGDAIGAHVSDGGDRLVQPIRARLGAVQ